MSIVTYNGITLPYSYCTSFTQSAVNDESGTDKCLTKYDIRVQCVISYHYARQLVPGLVGTVGVISSMQNPANLMAAIREALLQKRKRLLFTFNGINLIPAPPTGNLGTVDSANGPDPQSCEIMELTNQTYLMSYHIIAHYAEKTTFLAPGANLTRNDGSSNVIFNRWTEYVSLDENQMTTRVRSGKYRIASDNRDGFIADQLRRQFAVTGVPFGFLRANSKYTVSEDGLSIRYELVDVEQFKMPARPSYTADGKYTETGVKNGAQRYGEVEVILTGAKDVPQQELVDLAVAICANKLFIVGAPLVGKNIRGAEAPKPAIVEQCSIGVDMYKNIVRCNIRAMFATHRKRLHGIPGLPNSLVFTPFSDEFQGRSIAAVPAYYVYGTANVLLQAAAYYDPTLRPGAELNPATGQMTRGLAPGQAGKTREP